MAASFGVIGWRETDSFGTRTERSSRRLETELSSTWKVNVMRIRGERTRAASFCKTGRSNFEWEILTLGMNLIQSINPFQNLIVKREREEENTPCGSYLIKLSVDEIDEVFGRNMIKMGSTHFQPSWSLKWRETRTQNLRLKSIAPSSQGERSELPQIPSVKITKKPSPPYSTRKTNTGRPNLKLDWGRRRRQLIFDVCQCSFLSHEHHLPLLSTPRALIISEYGEHFEQCFVHNEYTRGNSKIDSACDPIFDGSLHS